MTKSNFFTGIDPEDAFLDSSNMPDFDAHALEGRIIKALSRREVYTIGIIFTGIIFVFIYKLVSLQIINTEQYMQQAIDNKLSRPILFAERGIIKDRFGQELAWNTPQETQTKQGMIERLSTYSLREYTNKAGMAHILGFVSYPEQDAQGNWWRPDFIAHTGVEKSFDAILRGQNGNRLIEKDALQNIVSSGAIIEPINGKTLTLSIDSRMTEKLFNAIKEGADTAGFVGGAGIIMDVDTGEIIALTSYPEYDPNILTDANDSVRIAQYSSDSRKPFLNRVVQGSYTPGSIIKPYIGAVALEEGIITEYTKILSTGILKVPNPYYPGRFSTFRDWRMGLGWLDIREAIKMSSSIFFYVIGGGFEERDGLGIEKISKWASMFGFGKKTGIALSGERVGVIPTPQWKKSVFGEDKEWNLGNTYHSAIGQYGWLVTPVQAVKYIAGIANGGKLYRPVLTLITKDPTYEQVPIQDKNLAIVREGMRLAVQGGTAQALSIPGISIAAKTGTAQLGRNNEYMNSWVVGFWPFDSGYGKQTKKPKYAFAVVLEKAPAETLRGAAPAMRQFFTWLVKEHGDDYAIGRYPQKDTSK